MFYLIEIFKILKKQASAAFFFAITILLFVCTLGKNDLDRHLKKNFAVEKPLPSFHVLMTGQVNVYSLTRKVKQLPGVKIVKVKENASINNQAKDLIDALKLDDSFGIDVGSYLGLQIFTKPNITEKSFNLIKEYIQRISGESRITFSKITNPDMIFGKTKELAINLLHRFGAISLILLLFSFWILSLVISYPVISKRSFIIENFQRKKYAKFKILISFIGVALAVSLLITIFLNSMSIVWLAAVLLATVMICLMSLNKTQWN